ncbi:SH3 domain-binding glutamic acid-rich-like protein 2 [Pitangus sulphuratus]|nr:SH3 domain-binding glutamic acid-rich-like protein 2 [Pitangus sulphuratus]
MVIRVFVASSSGSVAIKKRQQDVVRFLEANRIEFEEVDITMSEEKRQWMYKNIPEDRQPAQGNPLPPQIFSDDRYCGDYDGFFESKESNTVFSFLGLKPTLASKPTQNLRLTKPTRSNRSFVTGNMLAAAITHHDCEVHQVYSTSYGPCYSKPYVDKLESVQRRPTKMIEGLHMRKG